MKQQFAEIFIDGKYCGTIPWELRKWYVGLLSAGNWKNLKELENVEYKPIEREV